MYCTIVQLDRLDWGRYSILRLYLVQYAYASKYILFFKRLFVTHGMSPAETSVNKQHVEFYFASTMTCDAAVIICELYSIHRAQITMREHGALPVVVAHDESIEFSYIRVKLLPVSLFNSLQFS